MNFYSLAYLCLLLCTGSLSKKSKVVGGIPSSITAFPHMVSLRNHTNNQFICGGSIISQWNVITAAHCLYLIPNNYNQVKVYTGTCSSGIVNGMSYFIEEVRIHEDFIFNPEQQLFLHDIALIRVRESMFMSLCQSIIHLPTHAPYSQTVGYVIGWGGMDSPHNAVIVPTLTVSSAIIINNADCGAYYGMIIYASQFCTISLPGVGIYAGDAGGSVTYNGQLYGIVSYTFNRIEGAPTVHTKLYYYLDFIRTFMRE